MLFMCLKLLIKLITSVKMQSPPFSTDLYFLFFKKGLFFFIFVFSIQLTENVQYKFLPVTGFEPLTSGIGSNRSTN